MRLAESCGQGWQQGLDISVTLLAAEQVDLEILKVRHEPQDVSWPKRWLGPGSGFASWQQNPGENQGMWNWECFQGELETVMYHEGNSQQISIALVLSLVGE